MESPVTFLHLGYPSSHSHGCSSGIGESFVPAIIARGDRVIATARNATERLQHAKGAGAAILDLDITAPRAELDAKVQEAIGIYGTLDVLVKNAGYIEASLVEEASYDRLIAQFNTNLFGTLVVTQSVLPHFHKKKAGIIAFIGSVGGWAGDPGAGPYCGTKFALEGMVECLQQETAQFSIQSVIFEPGYYQTKIMSPANVKTAPLRISEYEEIDKAISGFVAATNGNQPGDPRKLVERIIDVVNGRKNNPAEASHRTRFDGCHQKEVRDYIEALRGMGDFDHEHGYSGCRVGLRA